MNVVVDDACTRLIPSHINIALNTTLLLILIASQIPPCVRITALKSNLGISPYHFFLDAFYQTIFISVVLYVSSIDEGPIECCRPNGLYAPYSLTGVDAYGVLLGALQVDVVFLSSLARLILFLVYIPRAFSLPLSGNEYQRVAKIYGRIGLGLLSLFPVGILIDTVVTAY